MKEEKNSKKIIKNTILFVILIILTYIFIFRKMDRKGLQDALHNTNIWIVLLGAFFAFFNIFFEAVNHYRNLKLLNEKTTFLQCLKYGIVGFFFSAITPAATGGQPVQIIYMHKDGITYTHATIVILIQSFTYIATMIFLGIVGYIINFNHISNLGFFEYFFFIGVIVNSIITIVIILAMFSKKLSQKLLNLAYRILYKINEDKAQSFKEKMEIQLQEYHSTARFILDNKKALIKTIITNLMQLIGYHSTAFFIFLALGVHGLNYIKITSMQSFLYLSVSILPLPGTIGVNETGFTILYKHLISQNIIDSAMLLTRGVSFYLYVIITGIILLIIALKKKRTTK